MKRLILAFAVAGLLITAASSFSDVSASQYTSRYVMHSGGVDIQADFNPWNDNYDAYVNSWVIWPTQKWPQSVDNIVLDVIVRGWPVGQWWKDFRGVYYHQGCFECSSMTTGFDHSDAYLWLPYYGLNCMDSKSASRFTQFTLSDEIVFREGGGECR